MGTGPQNWAQARWSVVNAAERLFMAIVLIDNAAGTARQIGGPRIFSFNNPYIIAFRIFSNSAVCWPCPQGEGCCTSMEKEQWYAMVFEAVQEIPPGKVTSYGHIARLIGRRESGKCIFSITSLTFSLAECPR